MKWLAIALNISLVGVISYILLTKGAPNENEVLFVVLCLAAPVSSLIALTIAKGNSWIGLYFKRKKLEERQRIRKLEGQ